MNDAGIKFKIHNSILEIAKDKFSRFRDVREHVHNKEACTAACIVLALQEYLRYTPGQILTRKMSQLNPEFIPEFQFHPPNYLLRSRGGAEEYRQRVYEVVPQTVLVKPAEVKNSSVEIVTLEGVPMGSWSLDQCHLWLGACVASLDLGDSQTKQQVVDAIISRLIEMSRSSTTSSNSKKIPDTLPTLKLLGTLTHADRQKKLAKSEADSRDIIGKKLLSLNSKAVLAEKLGLFEKNLRDSFAACVQKMLTSRLLHDSQRKEQEHRDEIEMKRLNAERAVSERVGVLASRSSGTTTVKPLQRNSNIEYATSTNGTSSSSSSSTGESNAPLSAVDELLLLCGHDFSPVESVPGEYSESFRTITMQLLL